MIERVWTATISWGNGGKDLDIFAAVSAGGQTSSGVGWRNGQETTKIVVQNGQVNGAFYAIWGGDNTSFAGSETVTVYFRGESLPAGNVEVATLAVHLNFYGEGSSPVTITVSNQGGSYTGTANTRYGNRAEASDPAITVPILANGGSQEAMYLVELSTLPQAWGTAFGGGLFANGNSCTVSATPGTGYSFIGWYEGSTLVSTSSSYTFSVSSDRSLVAHFAAHVDVVASPTNGGTVSGDGDFASGESCTIVATPYSNYKFVKWTNNRDSTTPRTATHTFTVADSITWTAIFVPIDQQYTVSVYPDQPANGSVTGGGTFDACSVCSINATPANFLIRFDHWSFSDGRADVSTASYSFILDSDVVCTAHFASNPVNVAAMVKIDGFVNNPKWYIGQTQVCALTDTVFPPQGHTWSRTCSSSFDVILDVHPSDEVEFVRWEDPDGSVSNTAVRYVVLMNGSFNASQIQSVEALNGENIEALVFCAVFRPKTLRVRLEVESGWPHAKLRLPMAWQDRYSTSVEDPSLTWMDDPPSFLSLVRVIQSTDRVYEAEVPFTVSASTPDNLNYFPTTRPNWHVYGYMLSLWEGYPPDTNYPNGYSRPIKDHFNPRNNYWDDANARDIQQLSNDVDRFCAIQHAQYHSGLPERFLVLFHVERYDNNSVLCTNAGKMLCNSSGQLMFAG